MTRITQIKNNNILVGFEIDGHVNYAEYGKDIVCSAISTLSINTVNSLVQIADVFVEVETRDGYMKYFVQCDMNMTSRILLNSALLGYESISEQYKDYVICVK